MESVFSAHIWALPRTGDSARMQTMRFLMQMALASVSGKNPEEIKLPSLTAIAYDYPLKVRVGSEVIGAVNPFGNAPAHWKMWTTFWAPEVPNAKLCELEHSAVPEHNIRVEFIERDGMVFYYRVIAAGHVLRTFGLDMDV